MPTADNDTLLIFRIAAIACAVPAQSVDTIVMPPDHLTHPPGTGKSTPGIFQHSRQVHAVIDLHERFGIDAPRQGIGRLLLHHEGGRHYAFWVDEVVGLVRSEQGQWAPLPPYMPRSLFWSGFLYRKEIVLCTQLDVLRRMRDASPLHRHLAALQPPQEKPASEKIEEARQRDESARPPPPPRRDAEPASPPRPPVAERQEPAARAAARPGARPVPPTPRRPVASTPPTSRVPPAKPAPTKATRPDTPVAAPPRPAQRPGKPQGQRPVPNGHSTPAPGPERSVTAPVATPVVPSPPAASPASAPWPLLLLILGLGIGGVYWLWSATTARTADSAPRLSVEQTAYSPPVRLPEVEEQPAPAPTEAIASIQPLNTGDTQPAEAAPPPTAGRPLQIERDSEGTINLIIDRAAIQAQMAASAISPRAPSPSAAAGATDAPAPAAPSLSQGDDVMQAEATTPAVEPEAEEESPLQPEPDWPAPIPATVEPCDCTHIVVKGDTLWDIAEHYTRNAFNYHELARRSGIRNPDRIYPGDKVRIIIR